MKVACLILAYAGAPVLARSLPVYLDAGWDVFLHIDPKLPRDSYLGQLGPRAAECRVVQDPVRVFWAGFSMIEAELKLIELARRSGDYDKFLLLSDDTLPIYPAAELRDALAREGDRITAVSQSKTSRNGKLYEKFIFADHEVTSLRPGVPTAEIDERLEAAVLEITGLRRIGKKPVALHYGSQFWALGRDSMEHILRSIETDRHLYLSFKYASFSDEMYFQTILAQERHRGGIATGPVYADFYSDPGKTRVFRAARDLPFDLHESHLFVRKICPKATAFLDESAAWLAQGRTILGNTAAELRQPMVVRDFGDGGADIVLRLDAPSKAEGAGTQWTAPERYLQQLYRWTATDRVEWRFELPALPPGRLRCHLPHLLAKPGFPEQSRLLVDGQTSALTDTRYSLIADFTYAGGGGELVVTLQTPPPVVANPGVDPRRLGIGIAMRAEPAKPEPLAEPVPEIVVPPDDQRHAALARLRQPMEAFLRPFAGEEVLFYPNPGNAGDSLIAMGEYEAFRRAGVKVRIIDIGSDVTGRSVFVGGGGNLVPLYRSVHDALSNYLGKARRIVILPHTIRGHEPLLARMDETCTVFCRDPESLAHVSAHAPRAQALPGHDMALHVDAEALLADPKLKARALPRFAERFVLADVAAEQLPLLPVVHFLRTDDEAAGPDGGTDADISALFDFGVGPDNAPVAAWCLLHAVQSARRIRTDRLHVGIAAALLGKPCELLDNSYGKNRAVHAHSLSELTHVRLIQTSTRRRSVAEPSAPPAPPAPPLKLPAERPKRLARRSQPAKVEAA